MNEYPSGSMTFVWLMTIIQQSLSHARLDVLSHLSSIVHRSRSIGGAERRSDSFVLALLLEHWLRLSLGSVLGTCLKKWLCTAGETRNSLFCSNICWLFKYNRYGRWYVLRTTIINNRHLSVSLALSANTAQRSSRTKRNGYSRFNHQTSFGLSDRCLSQIQWTRSLGSCIQQPSLYHSCTPHSQLMQCLMPDLDGGSTTKSSLSFS
jgi:hypothetical protein